MLVLNPNRFLPSVWVISCTVLLGYFLSLQENGIVKMSKKYPHAQFTSKYTAKFEPFWQ